MWEAEPEDLFFLDNDEFFSFTEHNPANATYFPQPTQIQPSRKQSMQFSKRTGQNYIRKIRRLQRRIRQLETELEKTRISAQKIDCCRCFQLDRAHKTTVDLCESCQNIQTQEHKIPQIQYLQFEQFQMISGSNEASKKQVELNGQSWIVMGMMMIVMGVNINGFDSTSLDVYKLAKESISSIRQQVQQSSQQIILPIFYSKLFRETDSEAATGVFGGFEMQGVRMCSIQEERLMFEQHLSLRLKYEGLLLIAQYMKQYIVLD